MFYNWFGVPAGGGAECLQLEVVERGPQSRERAVPLVFVHGAHAGAWCWDEHFLPYFCDRGYRAVAVSLRGHGGSEGRDQLHYHSLTDYVDDLESVVGTLPRSPVLVGHSMGGAVVQKYLERQPAAAAVLMASVPPYGLGGSVFRLMTTDPVLFMQISLMHGAGPESVSLESAGRAVFSEGFDPDLMATYARRMQGESRRALMGMTFLDLPAPGRMHPCPMLVMGAEDDTLFSTEDIAATARAYDADLHLIPGMAHAMMLEANWREAADALADWLERVEIH